MKHLPLPTDKDKQPFAAGDVYETCVSMVRNNTLRGRLRSIRAEVEAEAIDYDTKAAVGQLYLKQPHKQVGPVIGEEIVKVYTYRMVPNKSTGRAIYDTIMSAPEHRKCPMCGIGTVNTLDHYLPKIHFPVFSVTPNNLVPVCQWCQKEKGEYYSTSEEGQLLHPYFDNVDDDIWLTAEVVETKPAGFKYSASAPANWPQSLIDRVAAHLKELNLLFLFSTNAGSRLSEIRNRLFDLHLKGGFDSVRAHLNEELRSLEAVNKNSWATAMYRAAIASEWFCDGGFHGE